MLTRYGTPAVTKRHSLRAPIRVIIARRTSVYSDFHDTEQKKTSLLHGMVHDNPGWRVDTLEID